MNTNEMLKVVVLSGGSGNDALIKGLKQLFGQEKKKKNSILKLLSMPMTMAKAQVYAVP